MARRKSRTWTSGEFISAHWDWAVIHVPAFERAMLETVQEGRDYSPVPEDHPARNSRLP